MSSTASRRVGGPGAEWGALGAGVGRGLGPGEGGQLRSRLEGCPAPQAAGPECWTPLQTCSDNVGNKRRRNTSSL